MATVNDIRMVITQYPPPIRDPRAAASREDAPAQLWDAVHVPTDR